MVNALSEVDGNILDCKKSIEEFDNELLNLHTEIFNRIQEQFSALDSEISNLIDLFDEFEVSDEKGIWSKEGIAQLGLLTQQYELAQYQIRQYNNEIDELNQQYLAGKYSATEYADKLAELNSQQWDAVKSGESALAAIMDLNEVRVDNAVNGIEKEIDAYQELIDAQIEALHAKNDLHDYENSIAEKTKAVADLEYQIEIMRGDTSAATIAKRKKLEEQLAEVRKDLEETEYDHSIETQEDALNKQYEQYEKSRNDEIDALRESLNDKEAILSTSFEAVKNNASVVGQEIATIATQHGITVSNTLISSWQSGEKAIAGYGEVLSQNTSAFIGNIMGVENEVWNLQAQANTTADSLAWMFSTKADNLVSELNTSYYAEANLANMTNALQQSLVNTLERGYDVSSIVNSIDSVTAAAGRAKTAIEDLKLLDISSSGASGGGSPRVLPERPTTLFYPSFAHYANGTRSSKGNIIISDEEGCEMKLPKLANGQYTIANEGTQILTKAQTDNIFDWSKFNPVDFIQPKLNISLPKLPEIVSRNVKPSVNMHYDSLVTINGDVNDTNHFIKQVTGVVERQLDRSFNDFKKEIL